jgi:phosphate transport system permease protein
MTKKPNIRKHTRAKGEVYVWVASMGLTVGLVMVAALLFLILANGLASFWPDRVARMEFKHGAAAAVGDEMAVAGEIVKKRAQRGTEPGAPAEYEYQLYVANRDAYGASFKYFPVEDVASISHPRGLLMIERMEYGNALGTPTVITLPSGESVTADTPDFNRTLEKLVHESNARRNTIQQIERGRIGAINARMTSLRNARRGLERDGDTDPAAIASIEEKTATLQSDYEKLAAEARSLRERQAEGSLEIRLASGQTLAVPLGDIITFYYPNELGVLQRLVLFVENFWRFLSENPREANTEGGIFPALFGTFVMTLLMSLAVVPFGVVAAIYLREYAVQGLLVRAVRIAVNNLAGVPSIVFGVFGLGFFVYFLGGTIDSIFFKDALPTPTFGTGGIFWAALTLALMTVPVVIVATEEALAAVPRGVREGSLACGASKWQTMQRLVLPAAAPGILTGLILAMARGAGEVAPLMLVGVVKLAPSLPIDGEFPFVHLERKFMHLGFHIYDLGFQSPDSEAARPMVFATTLLLILLVVLLNLAAIILRERLRKKYATAAF